MENYIQHAWGKSGGPHKYVRKYMGNAGKWIYVYADDLKNKASDTVKNAKTGFYAGSVNHVSRNDLLKRNYNRAESHRQKYIEAAKNKDKNAMVKNRMMTNAYKNSTETVNTASYAFGNAIGMIPTNLKNAGRSTVNKLTKTKSMSISQIKSSVISSGKKTVSHMINGFKAGSYGQSAKNVTNRFYTNNAEKRSNHLKALKSGNRERAKETYNDYQNYNKLQRSINSTSASYKIGNAAGLAKNKLVKMLRRR